ncbi:MAG: hypothetical protein ACFFDT_16415 [Candidatus Hodarchaeota archaeon]
MTYFFCIDVLEHIPNVEEAIKNIENALSYGRGLLIGTLPFQENLSRNMVICPKCHHKFHRIGHHHSFNSIDEIKQLLGPELDIIEVGQVKIFREVSDVISYIVEKISRFVFKKKIGSTVYFVAKLNEETLGHS